MNLQVIERDGEPEYAVLPWAEYQALLQAAGKSAAAPATEKPTADAPKPLAQLATLREGKGLSRDELARAVGISPHYLGMIESGERQPDAAILRALAWVLGISGWEAGA
ncbi:MULTISPECIES: helix-turn-helix transcriptional regulator [Pseudomonas]|uniref:Cro/Cl family transcriptional regulator n=2 Tax=Pseudomonadaceae TaxID=135621 RepID=A0A0D0JX43_9PSED|nr:MULTISPECIES: helix-turn-helix transcriptional regulator [Pseudomonas]KIP90864.1 Cro/Cl family transcriptional regulator [Pseudomonas fulva]MCW2291690.1 ribosome-binding protein aMBF1 (putative translation factor) [Pseudomonas sp. BIGb0408]NYH73739.1 ribosome-binding protein aMBF1 (putative translation factor) [Pseudomonas flavescens]